MLQPIRIRFTALSCFETNIYQRVFLRGLTHANKYLQIAPDRFLSYRYAREPDVTPFPSLEATKLLFVFSPEETISQKHGQNHKDT